MMRAGLDLEELYIVKKDMGLIIIEFEETQIHFLFTCHYSFPFFFLILPSDSFFDSEGAKWMPI